MSSHPLILHVPEILDSVELQPGQTMALGLYEVRQAVEEDRQVKAYQGWDTVEDIPVAIKLLNQGLVDTEPALNALARKIESVQQSAHPTFILPFHVVRLSNRTLIIEEWVHEIKLLTLMRSRGSLPLKEAVLILRPLAEGIDFAINQVYHPFDLTLRHVSLCFPEAGEFTEGKAATTIRVHEWPSYHVKINPLTITPSSKAREPLNRAFGKLFYQTLGGHLQRYGSNAYVPLPQLSEDGNAVLRKFLTNSDVSEPCVDVLRKVCQAESVAWDTATSADSPVDANQAEVLRSRAEAKQAQVEALLEERRREEERQRQEELERQEELRRQEELQRQEEARRQEELRQQEELRREEELRRLEELRQQEEELRRQEEELQRLEELRREEEFRQEEERRAQEELRREGERRQKEDLRRRQEELRRQQEEFRQQEELRRQEALRQQEEVEAGAREQAAGEAALAALDPPSAFDEETASFDTDNEIPLPPEPPVTSRSKLLLGSLAALLIAALTAYFFIKPIVSGPRAESVTVETLRQRLATLQAEEDWLGLYDEIPGIVAAAFDAEPQAALLEIARTAIPSLFADPGQWPEAESVENLDPVSREAVLRAVAEEAQRLEKTPAPEDIVRLLGFSSRAFPQAPPAEVQALTEAALATLRGTVDQGERLTESETALLQELAAREIAGATEVQKTAADLEATLEQRQALAAAMQEARQLVQEQQWAELFERIDAYASFPGDGEGELRRIAESSVSPLYQNLEDAPDPDKVLQKGPLTKKLVGEALAELARERTDPAYLNTIFTYANNIDAAQPNSDLLATGAQAATALAAKQDALSPDERTLVDSLAAYGVTEGESLRAELLSLEKSKEQALEDWKTVSAELDRSEQASEWFRVLAVLDDERLTTSQREEHAERLAEAGDHAAKALCQDPSGLPEGDQFAALGSHAREHLRQAVASAGQAVAQSGDVSALSAYLRWTQSQFPEEPVTALITAANNLADEIFRRGRNADTESGLKTLEALGSSRAEELLAQWQQESEREAKFQAALAEANKLVSDSNWRTLFDKLDTYLSGNFTPEQQKQLLSIGTPAVAARYQSLDSVPPHTSVSGFPNAKKNLVQVALQSQAQKSITQRSVADFQRWLAYERAAFRGTSLSNPWQSLGSQAVEILKVDAERNRSALEELSKHGIQAATEFLKELERQQKSLEWARERDAAVALARSNPGEALNRFLGFKRSHFGDNTAQWKAACQEDIDRILAALTSAQGFESQLTALARDGFPRAQHLSDQLTAEAARNAEPRTVEDFRKLFRERQKDSEFMTAYMKAVHQQLQARTPGAAQEMERLALQALSIGMVDAGFSTLDALYTGVIRPSPDALRQIPREFGGILKDHKAARKGWEGIWMMRGHPPHNGRSEAERHRDGIRLLQEAASQHPHSNQFLRQLRPQR